MATLLRDAASQGVQAGHPHPDGYLGLGIDSACNEDVIDYRGAHDYLGLSGFGASGLTEARLGTGSKEHFGVYKSFGTHVCDFCGCPMGGAEFERLRDGRERCNECSKSVLKRLVDYEELFSQVKHIMVERFGIDFPKPVQVRVVSQKRLSKEANSVFVPTSGFDARCLGLASLRNGNLKMFFESGSPKLPLMSTSSHELTHIWQYTHWDLEAIDKRYGESKLLVYEGMAVWVQIQFLYLVNEIAYADRQFEIERSRKDEYGEGFRMYLDRYPLSRGIVLTGKTPFMNRENPLAG